MLPAGQHGAVALNSAAFLNGRLYRPELFSLRMLKMQRELPSSSGDSFTMPLPELP